MNFTNAEIYGKYVPNVYKVKTNCCVCQHIFIVSLSLSLSVSLSLLTFKIIQIQTVSMSVI